MTEKKIKKKEKETSLLLSHLQYIENVHYIVGIQHQYMVYP